MSDKCPNHVRRRRGCPICERVSAELAESSLAAPTGSARPREYYILSLTHSPSAGCALWWGENNAGYTKNLLKAGRYPEAKVKEDSWYYNDGTATRAVPCDEVEATVMLSVDWNKARKSWAQVPNAELRHGEQTE